MKKLKLLLKLIIIGASLYFAYEMACPNYGVDLGICFHENKHLSPTWYLDSDDPSDVNRNIDNSSKSNINSYSENKTENTLPFTSVKTRLIGEGKIAVKNILDNPDEGYTNDFWEVWIYYKKVHDKFDNNKIKHLAVWFNRDGYTPEVKKVNIHAPKSSVYFSGNYIKLP